VITESEYNAMEQEITEEVADAIVFSDQSAEPAPENLYTDVYAD
jgi:TPP-dependent pyruvate/acetoin dehydrogenase alpha subunit